MRRLLAALAVMACVGATPAYASYINFGDPSDFTLFPTPTKWEPGPNAASFGPFGTPGSTTWSIMAAGLGDASGFHPGEVTADLVTSLGVAGWVLADYVNAINAMLNTWDAPSGYTNLGQVADGNVGMGAAQAAGGHLGDIRIGAVDIATANVLAHAFQPGVEGFCGPTPDGCTILGDAHFDHTWLWVDDPFDDNVNPQDFDLMTVMLHEFGHSLGLGHSNVVGSIMEPVYAGSRRTLHADDIAGIQFIYGPAAQNPVPEPASMLLLGTGLAGLAARRRRSKKS